ncbi:hypothetical protein GE253_04050 [Niveispirillum sp. SYP-B3756]|uniref:hypothetical protein n=1 Tax=Niveispirillum sp. SYP-B3756 TaxID=2662178 RepID=UPI00129096A6|nr:hypothetical protein [Niveispirillum sp. SYP-B3756]MQP64512.1 hypothetical protein [Niveispirillum sp. SYP-B3756]
MVRNPVTSPLFFYLIWFVAGLLLCGLLTMRVLDQGYMADIGIDRWRTALVAAADASAFRELFAVSFPPLALSADLLVGLLPGTAGVPLPLLVNVLAGATAAALWAGLLQGAGYGRLPAGLIALALLAQPPLQQVVASGSGGILGVLAFSLLVPAAIRMRHSGDVNAMAMVGVALALMMFSAASGVYMMLALLPFMVVLAPSGMVSRSPLGVLLVLLFPGCFTLAGYLYINWIFGGSAFAFAAGVDAVIRGAAANIGAHPWLLGWGHTVPGSLLAGAVMALLSLPLLPVALGRVMDRQARFTLLMLALAVLAAIAIGSLTRYLDHPSRLLVYLLPLGVVALVAAGPARLPVSLALLLALVSLAGGWLVQGYEPAPVADNWRQAMAGQNVAQMQTLDDAAFGRLLRNTGDIALDADASGMLVPGRGEADGLVLTSTDRLKADMVVGHISTEYVALQDPGSPRGERDRISQAFSTLWRDGPVGGTLVASRGAWRLWRMPDQSKAVRNGESRGGQGP